MWFESGRTNTNISKSSYLWSVFKNKLLFYCFTWKFNLLILFFNSNERRNYLLSMFLRIIVDLVRFPFIQSLYWGHWNFCNSTKWQTFSLSKLMQESDIMPLLEGKNHVWLCTDIYIYVNVFFFQNQFPSSVIWK